jgi:hypothetical protein
VLISKALCHEGIWRSGGIAPAFLTQHYMEVSGQLRTPAALPQGEKPQYPLNKSYVGPTVNLDIVEKRKNLALPGTKPGLPSL